MAPEEYMSEVYRLAGIDVHKSMLAVVVTEVQGRGDWVFERQKFGAVDSELKRLSQWLRESGVQEVVMESTAQYWKPVWRQLEGQVRLHLAQAQSNRARRGRKQDFQDAERLVRRHVAGELILSFVPDQEQRLWRTITRTKHQLGRDRVRLHNQLEALLEDARVKLSSSVSDLLGVSSRRMLRALAEGEEEPAQLAALAEANLKATPEQLTDALQAASEMSPLHRQILKLSLERLDLIEEQMETLHHQIAQALRQHQEAVTRLAVVPGLGVDSAQQIIAEAGPTAATFPSPQQLASWVGVCPGREESAEVSKSNRSPKGNRAMRRLLNQAANAAVKSKGSIFQLHYRRLVTRMGHNKAIWAIAHRLCKLVWVILHRGADYIEYGAERNSQALRRRTSKYLRELRSLEYQILPPKEPIA
jgi:transposase